MVLLASSAPAPNCGEDRPSAWPLTCGARLHPHSMFTVSDADAAPIRTAFEQQGKLLAAIKLRRLFPGITNNVKARACVTTIAG
jgi:hypothetical protein